MIDTQTLLVEIEKFLKWSGMKASTFGHKTANDGKLVERLRKGRSVELRTAERIRDFIDEVRGRRGKAGPDTKQQRPKEGARTRAAA